MVRLGYWNFHPGWYLANNFAAWEDSMEILASLYWTPGFLDQFQQDNGYSLVKYLPLLFSLTNSWNGFILAYPEQFSFGDYTAEGTSVHNLDYRTTLNKGYQAYVDQFESWAHTKGLRYSNQPAYNLPLQMVSWVLDARHLLMNAD